MSIPVTATRSPINGVTDRYKRSTSNGNGAIGPTCDNIKSTTAATGIEEKNNNA